MTVRRVVIGLGEDGRSRIVSDGPPARVFRIVSPPEGIDLHDRKGTAPSEREGPPGRSEAIIAELWSTVAPEAPIAATPKPETGFDLECPVGATRWRFVEMGPHRTAPMHTTSTIDYDTLLSGSIVLTLEHGETVLKPGDVAIIPGVAHGWRTGDEGCTMSIVMTGFPGPAGTS